MTDLATKPATESWGRWLGCSSSTRPHLTNSALGGDEFLCLFSRYDRQAVIAAAERILQRIGGYEFRMVPGEADRHAITASGGLGRRSQITHALFEVGGQYRRSM
jgi:PleD family two-component response regulator